MQAGRTACGLGLTFLLLSACTPATPDPAIRELVLFASNADDEGDIFSVPLEGGTLERVCAAAGPQGSPRARPARQAGVYADFSSQPAQARNLPDCAPLGSFEGDTLPVWLPRTDRVSAGNAESGDISLTETLGQGIREAVIATDSIERYPAWSGDETRLAFARRDRDGWSLIVRDLATGHEATYLAGQAYLGHLSWSPDGARLAFDMFVGGDAEIFTLDLASGEARRLTERPGHDLAPGWSRTGRYLAFTGQPADSEARDIFRIDLDTGIIDNLTTSPANETGPVILPASWLED